MPQKWAGRLRVATCGILEAVPRFFEVSMHQGSSKYPKASACRRSPNRLLSLVPVWLCVDLDMQVGLHSVAVG